MTCSNHERDNQTDTIARARLCSVVNESFLNSCLPKARELCDRDFRHLCCLGQHRCKADWIINQIIQSIGSVAACDLANNDHELRAKVTEMLVIGAYYTYESLYNDDHGDIDSVTR